MAQEGIGAALTISPDIMKQLETAQGLVDKMAAGAERIGAGFQTAATSVSSIVNSLQGKNMSMSFNVDGTIKEFTELGNVTVKLNQNMSVAEKGAAALNKALNMKEGTGGDSLRRKIAAIEKALNAPGLDAEKVKAANNTLSELNAKLKETETASEQAFNKLKAGVDLRTSGNLDKMRERLDNLKNSLRQLKALEKGGFAIPVGSIQATENAITALNNRIKATNDLLGATSKNAQMVRGLLTSAFSPLLIASFLKNLVSIRGEFEIAQKSLAVLIQNERVAADMFDEISHIAIKSPFSVLEMTKQVKQLAAYRIENEKLIETTKMLGDISAGVGVDMNRLILAYGQVKAATFLKGQELRQFSEAGVNMLGGLADRFTQIYQRAVSTGEVLQMVSKRMVKFEDVDAVLRAQTAEGGAFFRMQEKQAETLKGMVVNLQDRIQLMFNKTGTEFDRQMKNVVKGIEWVIGHADELVSVIMPILSFKFMSGGAGLLSNLFVNNPLFGKQNMFKGAKAAIQAVTAEIKLFNIFHTTAMTNAQRGWKIFKAAISGAGIGNVVGLIAAAIVSITLLIRRATALRREINKIGEDAKKHTDESIWEYNQLVDKATNIANKEQDRIAAIDELKKKYGQILPIQDLELSNVEALNKARAQQIELIREQIREEARGDAMRTAIKDLESGAKRRTKDLVTTLMQVQDIGVIRPSTSYAMTATNGFITTFKKEIEGLSEVTNDEIDAIRANVEDKIINGSIKTATDARDEFFRELLVRSGATEAQIEGIINNLVASSFAGVTDVFDGIIDRLALVGRIAKRQGADLLAPRALDSYRKQIETLQDARGDFVKGLTQEQKDAYAKNDSQREIDLQKFIADRRDEIEDAIRNAPNTVMTEEWRKKLLGALDEAYNSASDYSPVKAFVDKQIAEVNKSFPNLRKALDLGEVKYNDGDGVDSYIKKLTALGKTVYATADEFSKMDSEVESVRAFEIMAQWGGTAYNEFLKVDKAVDRTRRRLEKVNLELQKDPGNPKLLDKAEKLKATLTWQESNRKTMFSTMWESTTENLKSQAGAVQAAINSLGGSKTQLDEVQKGFKAIGSEILRVGKDWKNMTTEQKRLTKEQIQGQIDAFNQLYGYQVKMPELGNLGAADNWLRENQIIAGAQVFLELLMSIAGWQKTINSNGAAARKQRENDLKSLVDDMRDAVKQFDKLDAEGDKLLEDRIRESAKGLKIVLPEKIDKAAIKKFVEDNRKALGEENYLKLKLAINEEDTTDWIKNLSDQASALWDKYDNAKKLEGWGFGNIGVSSASIMSELEDLEKQLRAKETEEATKSADQIKEKRLQILRTEQEEAVKIMYEAQKKALTETEQAYQSMYEDIAKIRSDANKGETKFSQEQIDASVQDRIVKGMKEVEKAEWNAYKSTRAYAMAFGDLDNLGLDVLETLQAQLEYYSEFQNLNPSDMKAVADAMLKVNAAIEQQKTGQGFGGVFLEGFKQLAKAQEIFANRQSYEDSIAALKDEVRQTDELVATRKTMVRLYAGDEAEQEALADALAAQADARKRLEDAIKNYEKAMEKADTATEKAGVKLGLIESAYNSVGSAIGGVISLVKDTASIFGDGLGPEAEAAIEGFQQGFALVGQTIAIVNGALSVSASLAKLLKKEVATVLWPLAAVGVALGAVVAIFKSHNAKIDKQIEENKEAVENLKKAYDSLKESMERAMNLRGSAGAHSQMIANLNRQIELVKEQIALEEQSWRSRKKKDENIKEFNDQITELEESIRDTQKDWLEFMGSFSDSRNEAKSWASSWLDAFKDAGDGLEALGKSFEDLYDEIVAAQLSDILMPQMEALKQMIATAVSDGFIDEAESAAILAQREALEGLEDELRERARQLGVTSGDAETDTLQRGIQSITEQTAQALESILNSTRFYVADNNRLLVRMENALSGEENENSILANIRSQTRYLQILSEIANAVFSPGSSGQGAGGLKVFVMG